MRSFHIVLIAAATLQAQSSQPIADGPNYVPSILRESKVQPPPPITEQTGTAPGSDYIWMPGYYYCETSDCTASNPKVSVWIWISGNWTAFPFSGAIWSPHRWLQTNADHWILETGYWKRREEQPVQSNDPAKTLSTMADDIQEGGTYVPPKTADPESDQPQKKQVPQEEFRSYIANGQVVVDAFGHRWFQFLIGPGENGHITGDFSASEPGINARIDNGVIKRDKKKGILARRATIYWTTESAQSGNIDVTLGPGTYFLHFNNPTVLFTENPRTITVNAQVALYIVH